MNVKQMSVKELIAALKKCPDQDAFVMIKPESGGDMQHIDGAKPAHTVVFLTLGKKGWW